MAKSKAKDISKKPAADVDPDVDEGLPSDDDIGSSVDQQMTPQTFGTFAHVAYTEAAEDKFQDESGDRVATEMPVIVTKPDGTKAEGKLDLLVDNTLADFKTNDMRDWSVSDAKQAGGGHGRQVQEYVDSPGTPDGTKGFVVSTVPPKLAEVRAAYEAKLAEHGVGVKFSEGEDPTTVMNAVQEAVDETEGGTNDTDIGAVEEISTEAGSKE